MLAPAPFKITVDPAHTDGLLAVALTDGRAKTVTEITAEEVPQAFTPVTVWSAVAAGV